MKANSILNLRPPFTCEAPRCWRRLLMLLGVLFFVGRAVPVYAGGGGENILLIVNPNDEPSLRIANAYVQGRRIPVNNILYIAPPTGQGFTYLTISDAQFASTYQSAVSSAITARGLTNQIDYIGTLGQPHSVSTATYPVSFNSCLSQLTRFQNGVAPKDTYFKASELFRGNTTNTDSASWGPANYTHGNNAAIHHLTHYTAITGTFGPTTGTVSYAQWYMSGMIGYAGYQGLTPTQVIQNLQRTIAGDGAKPGGTMYFENSIDSARVSIRQPYWPAVESYMTAQGLPWIEEILGNNGITPVPTNRRDVIGAVIGSADYPTPYGSIYLPGSWVDSLTSNGGFYGDMHGQTLAAPVLLAGAGGSSGCVYEPGTVWCRFPAPSLTLFSRDGSTLGEAFYMTVAMPDTNMFQGDLLSQVHADIPSVAFTSGPADGATISGSVTLSGSAYLPNLNNQSTATGIAKLRLFVDGLDTGAFVSAASGSFILDTTTLTDGIHEVRFVAFNNSAAASQGRASKNFQVNNLGQSVSVTGSSSYNVGASQTISIPVSASQGSGPVITGIQLQSLGRVVGSISGVSGNVSLSGTSLAYGSNTLTPVAILSGGGQVQGPSVTVTRRFQPIAGSASTPLAQRNPGFDFYYFPGAAQKTIAATNFSGTPAYVRHSNTLQINPVSSTPGLMNMPDAYRVAAGGTNVGLAVMIKGAFTVTTAGEYAFGFTASALSSTGGVKGGGILWSSYSLEIDGITVSTYDCWSGSTFNAIANQADTLRSAYLLPGEHTITVKLANVPSNGTNTADASLGFLCQFRGLDANMRGSPAMFQTFNTNGYAAAPYFYTVNKNAGH